MRPSTTQVSWVGLAALVLLALLTGTAVVTAVVWSTRGAGTGTTPHSAPHAASEDGYAVWDRNDDGTPVRWDPCRPVRIVASGVGAPTTYPLDQLVADLEHAAGVLREATEIELTVIGTSTEVPDASRSTLATEGASRAWAPVLVGWRAPGEGDLPLRDVDRAVAVPVAVGTSRERVYVTAQVVLNPERTDLVPGARDRSSSWGATLLHELAHVLGLDHVDDPDQLLHTYPGVGPVELGAGDRAGLRTLGAEHGCLDVPEPRELDVVVPAG
ncbi:MAG: hypothetical protein WEB09_00025 [Nitriliruptor sp.]